MVSTRQMTNVSGSAGTSTDSAVQSSSSENGPAKFTRHSTVITTLSQIPQTSSHENQIAGPSNSQKESQSSSMLLLDLPPEIIEKIFSYLSYKNVAHLRMVCHTMDRICGGILNSTFQRLQKQMLNRFQSIKAKMPRRESARRNHPLACESDIIETLHMRLTLLQMSFGKHIERKHCCFFAGEILDEVFRILHYIKVTTKLARPYKVTDELFDLSTMAMEYFKEHIEPRLPEIAYFGADFLDFTGTFSSSSNNKNYLCLDSSPLGAGSGGEHKGDESPSHNTVENQEGHFLSEPLPQSNMVLRKRIRKIKQGMKRYNSQLTLLRQDLRACKRKTAEQQKQIAEQQKQLAEQQKQTLEYATRLDENDKKNEETSRKFSTLLQELNKCKTELQYWRSKSPATPPICKGCGAVFAPLPQEDLQALVNQGVRPEGLGIVMDDLTTAELEPSVDIKPVSDVDRKQEHPSEDVQIEQPNHVLQAKPIVGTKRKAIDEPKSTQTNVASQDCKKSRRISKCRSKRSKV